MVEADHNDVSIGDEGGTAHKPAIASLDDVRFVTFRDDYLRTLREQPIDLVLCIDRTSSMTPTINAVKTSAAMMIDFLNQAASSVRIGVVTYAGMPSELTALPLTNRPFPVQQFIRSIALGRGSMETVTLALTEAIDGNTFRQHALKVVILIGDEPYQQRHRDELLAVLERALGQQIMVCTVKIGSESQRDVGDVGVFLPEFDEIARLGGGRCASLDQPSDVSRLILALAIGGSWPEQLGDLLAVYGECVP
jgi:uncharacterized protein YegL